MNPIILSKAYDPAMATMCAKDLQLLEMISLYVYSNSGGGQGFWLVSQDPLLLWLGSGHETSHGTPTHC